MESVEFDFDQPAPKGWGEQAWTWTKRISWVLFVLANMGTCSRITKLAENQAPAFVQTADGYGIAIAKHDSNYRDQQFVAQFIQDWLTISFNWDAKLNGQGEPIKDQGQPVAGKKVPSDTWLGSFVLSEDLRPAWLSTIANNYEMTPFLTGQKSRVLRIKQVDIETTEPGTYQATVIATWFEFSDTDKAGKGQRFNRRITMQAIQQANPRPPQIDQGPHEQALYALLSKGLLITDIKEYKQ